MTNGMTSYDKTELSELKKGLVSRDILDSFDKDSLVDLLPGVDSTSEETKILEIIPRHINFDEEDGYPKPDDIGSVYSEECIGQSLCRDHLGKNLFILLSMFSVIYLFLKNIKKRMLV